MARTYRIINVTLKFAVPEGRQSERLLRDLESAFDRGLQSVDSAVLVMGSAKAEVTAMSEKDNPTLYGFDLRVMVDKPEGVAWSDWLTQISTPEGERR